MLSREWTWLSLVKYKRVLTWRPGDITPREYLRTRQHCSQNIHRQSTLLPSKAPCIKLKSLLGLTEGAVCWQTRLHESSAGQAGSFWPVEDSRRTLCPISPLYWCHIPAKTQKMVLKTPHSLRRGISSSSLRVNSFFYGILKRWRLNKKLMWLKMSIK